MASPIMALVPLAKAFRLTTMSKRWEVAPLAPEEYRRLFSDLPPLAVQLLYNRGVRTTDDVQAFLSRSFTDDNPFKLAGMNEAVTRLRHACRKGERIAVYGDYDVDGVTATALLVPLLRALGCESVPYIPNRLEEGYGLNMDAVSQLAEEGVDLLVTVDCGVRSVQEVELANRLGLDMIITDHHGVGDGLPPAVAVIDPKRHDDAYPFRQLAGVGLAFKLAQALLLAERAVPVTVAVDLPVDEDMLDLVALGTVADLAPLIGENRALVSRGLEKLNEAQRPGVEAMLLEAGLECGQITSGTVGYVLGPRLNAAGRLDDAMVSYRLLTTSSPEEARTLADQLGAQNRHRQNLTRQMAERGREQVREYAGDRIFVLADRGYLSGIAGLVASRIQEEFYRPTLVIALEDGASKGSARSIAGFHITQALEECRDLLVKFGGHSAAAGFTIPNEHIDAFRERLRNIADRELSQEDLVPVLAVDLVLPLVDVGWVTWSQIELLQPFGIGNPRPTLLSQDVGVRSCRNVGSDGSSLKFKLRCGSAVWDAIAFRQRTPAETVPPNIDVVYSLQSGVWNGEERLELVIKDWRPASGDRVDQLA